MTTRMQKKKKYVGQFKGGQYIGQWNLGLWVKKIP